MQYVLNKICNYIILYIILFILCYIMLDYIYYNIYIISYIIYIIYIIYILCYIYHMCFEVVNATAYFRSALAVQVLVLRAEGAWAHSPLFRLGID